MNSSMASSELTKSYLLGELDQEARLRFEETLIVDERYHEAVLIAEEELIDRYLSDDLNEHERERFLQNFLITPGRRQKLDFARTFRAYVTSHTLQPPVAENQGEESPSSWERLLPLFAGKRNLALRLAFAAMLLLVVLPGSWVVWKRLLQSNPPKNLSSNTLTVTLASGLTRSAGEVNRIAIHPGVTTVQLRLEPTVFGQESYRAKLLTDEGTEIFSTVALKDGGDRLVDVAIPAELLVAGDYRIKLDGSKGGVTEGAGTYYFRVARE